MLPPPLIYGELQQHLLSMVVQDKSAISSAQAISGISRHLSSSVLLPHGGMQSVHPTQKCFNTLNTFLEVLPPASLLGNYREIWSYYQKLL